ncbi:MAG: phage antirepressor [Motilibacteraceae bacterium]
MTAALEVFSYSTTEQVRTLVIDGEPWFVAADVARCLGYRMASDMTRRLDEDEKGTRSVRTPGGDQEMAVISEPGLYAAILGSQVEGAKAFKRWITHEVIPEIRRNGQYVPVPRKFSEALALAAEQQRRIEEQEEALALAAPKVQAYDALMDADGFYTMDAAAKVLGIGRNTLFRRLRDSGVLISGSNLPYQRYAHHFKVTAASYTDRDGVEHLTHTTRVLPSGLDFLRRKLDDDMARRSA